MTKHLIITILSLIIISCASAKIGRCPPEDAVIFRQGWINIIPENFFNWENEKGVKYWMPFKEYLELINEQKRREGGL